MSGSTRTLGIILLFSLELILAGPAGASPIEDILGAELNPTNPGWPGWWTAKGNALRVDADRVLIEQAFRLRFSGTVSVGFSVYQSPVEFGTYQRVQSNTVALVGGPDAGWYSSGPIDVPLQAGSFYILAVSFPQPLTYFYNVQPDEPVSFGAQVHGFATGLDPLGETIDSLSDDLAVYHQRINTIPEPATLALLALGALLVMRRRR